jgi:hypothetical protein
MAKMMKLMTVVTVVKVVRLVKIHHLHHKITGLENLSSTAPLKNARHIITMTLRDRIEH